MGMETTIELKADRDGQVTFAQIGNHREHCIGRIEFDDNGAVVAHAAGTRNDDGTPKLAELTPVRRFGSDRAAMLWLARQHIEA